MPSGNTPLTTARDVATWNQFAGLSAPARAASNFLDTLGLAANAATLGLGGGAVDWIKGQPWGTEAHDARVRVNNSGPIPTGAAADAIGSLAGGKAVFAGVKALPSLARAVFTTAPIGTRAAMLGATADAALGTKIARVAAVPAIVGGATALAASGNGEPVPVAAAPATASDAVANALATGTVAEKPLSAQDQLSKTIASILGRNPSMSDIQALGQLIPATIKQGATSKDITLGQTAQLSQQMFAQDIANAQELAKTDAAGAKAQVAKATDAYFKRNAGLVGLNPENLTMAQQFANGAN